MVRIDISKGNLHLWAFSLVVILGIGFVLAVVPWNSAEHPMWHSASDIKINIDGADTDLQSATNDGSFGGEDDQTLSIAGQTLSISEGNSVTLPASCVITSIDAKAQLGNTYKVGYWSSTGCTNCPFGLFDERRDRNWRYYCKHYSGVKGPMCAKDNTDSRDDYEWEIDYRATFTCSE